MTREAGRVFGGRYRLIERIDAGGAGEVWRARDERLDRDVAVKVLGADADAAFRKRFTDEARRAARIAHPNVVTVFDEGEDGTDAYMVMEHVPGRTLRDIVQERGALEPRDAARIVAQIGGALDAAHDAGVIHCDVKPANVILDERGIAKLADFGVARAARGPAEQELIATPRYIAPERIEGKAPVAASDVYGLGLIAYELLSGTPPWEGLSTEELLRERLEAPPPSLRRARPDLPAELDLVIAKSLARDPRRRYQRAGEMARDLAAAARGEATRTISVVPPRPLRRSGPPRVTSTAAILAVAIVVLAVALLFMRYGDTPSFGGPTPSPTAVTGITPNVVGKDLKAAVRELVAAGYQPVSWDVARDPGGAARCNVVSQSPASGTPVRKGTPASVLYVPGNGCTSGL